jgi:hypothetical protein
VNNRKITWYLCKRYKFNSYSRLQKYFLETIWNKKSCRELFVVIFRRRIFSGFKIFQKNVLVHGFSQELKSRYQKKKLTRKRRGFSMGRFFCNVIECTRWSKLTGKVQLLVPEVIFQLFECTKRCTIICFLETVLWTRGHKWPQSRANGEFIFWVKTESDIFLWFIFCISEFIFRNVFRSPEKTFVQTHFEIVIVNRTATVVNRLSIYLLALIT